MREMIKNTEIFKRLRGSEITAAAAVNIIVGALGMLASRAVVTGGLMPFGIAMLAAAPYGYLPSVAVGAFLGYFINAISGGGFRYVAALLAVLVIKILLSGYKNIFRSHLFICAVSFLSLAVTAPVMLKDLSAISLVAETLLGAGSAYFFNVTFKAATVRKAGFYPDEMSAFLLVLSILVTGLGKINVLGIYLYEVLCVFTVLIAAKYGGSTASVAAGVSAAITVFFVGGNMEACLIMVLAGACTGHFRIYGKAVMSLTCVAAVLLGMIIFENNVMPALFAETVIACAVFLCIPRSFSNEVGKILSFSPKFTVQSDLKRMVKLKLLDASNALSDVKETVNEVSNRLSLVTAPDFSGMVKEIENAACAGCKLRIHCWESRKGATVEALMAVIEAKKRDEKTPSSFSGDEFKARCFRFDSFCKNAVEVYERYARSLAAENRAREVRQVVSEQFDGISLILEDTANDISRAERFDRSAAICVAESLKSLDIIPSEVVCRIDKFGRRLIKIKADANSDTVINKMQVMKSLSQALECNLLPPAVTRKGSDVFITLSEAPRYKVETGVCQIAAGECPMCGDSYKFINDGYGRIFMVLSDGMGTGGAAAVDSALSSGLVARLIKSGIGLDSALKIINSSMLFKSTYESTATLDIACIDLFNGDTSVYKAGAAPTVIKHGSRIATATGRSLPIGIINDVRFERADIRLKSKDILLMMSDGATGEGIEWIKRELENCGDISAQGLCENIALAARRRRSDGHEDDITVISAIIEKAI